MTKSLIFTASYLLSASLFVLKSAHVINISWLIVFSPMWLIPAIILAATFLAIIATFITCVVIILFGDLLL